MLARTLRRAPAPLQIHALTTHAGPRHLGDADRSRCQAVIAVMLFQPVPTSTGGRIHPPVPLPRYMYS
ncbi:hypothetical protein GCM10009742_53450 [Kribbella karoonensis]|uniref:Uncharacterized protein n=1 Tax=Kribbella karoonensis TaxID=324851 RepID=A0ABN2EAP2_9ACTN